jgi:multiple sugar transport system ATP-binding protein
VLKDGLLQQVGTPRELYDHPVNSFVAGFIGSPAMNLLNLPVVDGGVQFGDDVYPVSRDTLGGADGKVTLGVRPEDLDLAEHGLPVQVELVEVLGADAYVHGILRSEGTDLPVIARVDGRKPPQKGETVHLKAKEGHTHLFNGESGLRLGV